MPPETRRRNARTGLVILAIIVAMVGLSFASVPFYRLFCRATGYGGTTQTAKDAPQAAKIINRIVTVKFNSAVAPNVPWRFAPQQRQVDVKLGARTLISYNAENLSDETITGSAVYNVTPEKVGKYFKKIQCFCFTQQVLKPRQRAVLPVLFFVDPAFNDDPEMEGVSTITLSYTFFRSDFGTDSGKQGLDKPGKDSYNASSAAVAVRP